MFIQFYNYKITEEQLDIINENEENCNDFLWRVWNILPQTLIKDYLKKGFFVMPDVDSGSSTNLLELKKDFKNNSNLEYIVTPCNEVYKPHFNVENLFFNTKL